MNKIGSPAACKLRMSEAKRMWLHKGSENKSFQMLWL